MRKRIQSAFTITSAKVIVGLTGIVAQRQYLSLAYI